MLDDGEIGNSCIDDGLGGDRLATATAFVGGDDDSAATVDHSLAEGLGAETGKDYRVDGSNASTCKERGGGLPGHGKVDGDSVALLDAE